MDQLKLYSWNMVIVFKYFVLAFLWKIKSQCFWWHRMEKYQHPVLVSKRVQKLISNCICMVTYRCLLKISTFSLIGSLLSAAIQLPSSILFLSLNSYFLTCFSEQWTISHLHRVYVKLSDSWLDILDHDFIVKKKKLTFQRKKRACHLTQKK